MSKTRSVRSIVRQLKVGRAIEEREIDMITPLLKESVADKTEKDLFLI